MSLYLLPVAYTLFMWWFATGVILYLNGLPRWTYPWTMGAASVLLGIGLIGLVATRDDTRVTGAYLAFTCVLLVWGWQETAFLLGYVTGPRRAPCPADASGWRRAGWAVLTLLHHELALVVLGTAVLALTWHGTNPAAPTTFAIFWVMRLSAKLNIFLGVRNLGDNLLPAHLAYLKSYFRTAPMNALMPLSVVASGWLAVLMWQGATRPGASPFEATCLTLCGTLLGLAILEHLFMVLPLPSERLWNWGLRSRAAWRPARL